MTCRSIRGALVPLLFKKITFDNFDLDVAQTCQRTFEPATLSVPKQICFKLKVHGSREGNNADVHNRALPGEVEGIRAFANLIAAFNGLQEISISLSLDAILRPAARWPGALTTVLESDSWRSLARSMYTVCEARAPRIKFHFELCRRPSGGGIFSLSLRTLSSLLCKFNSFDDMTLSLNHLDVDFPGNGSQVVSARTAFLRPIAALHVDAHRDATWLITAAGTVLSSLTLGRHCDLGGLAHHIETKRITFPSLQKLSIMASDIHLHKLFTLIHKLSASQMAQISLSAFPIDPSQIPEVENVMLSLIRALTAFGRLKTCELMVMGPLDTFLAHSSWLNDLFRTLRLQNTAVIVHPYICEPTREVNWLQQRHLVPLPATIRPTVKTLRVVLYDAGIPLNPPGQETLASLEKLDFDLWGHENAIFSLQWYIQGIHAPNLKDLTIHMRGLHFPYSKLALLLSQTPPSCRWFIYEYDSRDLDPGDQLTLQADRQAFCLHCGYWGVDVSIVTV